MKNIRIALAVFVVLCLAACVVFCVYRAGGASRPKSRLQLGEIRSAPYPFKSLLAVCSDIDGTTLREFIVIHKYLNTEGYSYMGKGLGLDVADSFWMFAVNDDGAVLDYDGAQNAAAMSYYRPGASELKNNEEIVRYFECGWIDTIHSYGDFSRKDTSKPVFTKKHAELANREMLENGLLPMIWTNHGNKANVQNMRRAFSHPKFRYQQGANPKSQFYHSDFTVDSGIRYVWFSNPSAAFEVDTPLYPAKLQDGRMVWGFDRYTGESRLGIFGHRYNWSSFDFNEQVSEERLDRLSKSGGVAVIAQHFGAANGEYIFTGETKEGFERLKRYEEAGDILVARTSRLLEFVRTRDYLKYEYEENESGEKITIHYIDDPVLGIEKITAPEQLRGISFNVKNPRDTEIYLENGTLISEDNLIKSEPQEEIGVIGIKWYEKDVTDYTIIE